MVGTAERIVTDRAFRFLKGEDRKHYFFHRSGTSGFCELREGDSASFEATATDKGRRAENVALASVQDAAR